MRFAPGTRVDRYVFERLLGTGGMAEVYQVRHAELGTPFALKVLTLQAPSVRERLLQEGRVQARLQHPNIVRVTDVVDVDDLPGLVLEFVEGPSLEDLLERQRLTVAQADLIVQGILRGVSAAHALGFVHRDLKPANVLCAIQGTTLVPKVADFGIAKALETELDGRNIRTRSGMAMGTPSYMAPEQIEDARSVDHRADVFSLGAILYEVVTGRRAFDGKNIFAIYNKVGHGDYPPLGGVAPHLLPRMRDAIEGALIVDVQHRTQSVQALLDAWMGRDMTGEHSVFDVDSLRPGQVSAPAVAPSSPAPSTALGQASPEPDDFEADVATYQFTVDEAPAAPTPFEEPTKQLGLVSLPTVVPEHSDDPTLLGSGEPAPPARPSFDTLNPDPTWPNPGPLAADAPETTERSRRRSPWLLGALGMFSMGTLGILLAALAVGASWLGGEDTQPETPAERVDAASSSQAGVPTVDEEGEDSRPASEREPEVQLDPPEPPLTTTPKPRSTPTARPIQPATQVQPEPEPEPEPEPPKEPATVRVQLSAWPVGSFTWPGQADPVPSARAYDLPVGSLRLTLHPNNLSAPLVCDVPITPSTTKVDFDTDRPPTRFCKATP